MVADGGQVEAVLDLTGGHGAEVVLDFVAEEGAESEGVRDDRAPAGDYYVIGYGGNIDVPTIDIISTEMNFIGNLVGSYNDLGELMVLARPGTVTLHTQKYPLDDFQQALDDLDAGKVRGRAILRALTRRGAPVDLHHRQVPRPARARRPLAGDLAVVHRGHPRRAGVPVVRLVAQPRRPDRVRPRRGVPRRRRRRGPRAVRPLQRPRSRSCRRTSPRRRGS